MSSSTSARPDDTFPRQQARTRRFTLGAPRHFRVAPDSTRVVFLRSTGGDDPVNRLWSYELDTGQTRMVADPHQLLGHGNGNLPPEELARRERAREAGGGIVSYATNDAVTSAVFSLGGRPYLCDLVTGETAGLPSRSGAFDPRLDPTGKTTAYVAAGSLYLTDLVAGDRPLAVTDDDAVTYGLPEFVAAEEMRRSRGYWWSPDGSALLVSRTDTSAVTEWHIASPIDPATPATVHRYPAAGTANAQVSLAIHGLDGSLVDVAWNQGGQWEYLVSAAWSPESSPTIVAQSRDQRTMVVLTVDPADGAVDEVYRWTDETWIDIVVGAPQWVDSRLLTVEDRGAARRLVLGGETLTGEDLQIRRVIQADEHGIVAVASTAATQSHVIHVSLDGATTMLTTDAGVHDAETAGDVIVIISSTMERFGSSVSVVRSGETAGQIENLAESPLVSPRVWFHHYGKRELNTAVLLPQGTDRDTPLPVLLDPYGGPHAQRVVHALGAYSASQWFADQGFAVLVCDGRGTPGRGPAFEREVWGDLAQPVLDDQVAALEAAADDYPGLDLNRVGIRGWSFGGYLAALAVLRRPDLFHAGVAGAPVTDWALYDTHYTERYLGHPDEHPEHYERTDLTREAGALTRPLLLIHGLADDNVVAAHTLKMSRALLESGILHQVLPLSGVTHMTPQEIVAENLLLFQLAFLQQALGMTDEGTL